MGEDNHAFPKNGSKLFLSPPLERTQPNESLGENRVSAQEFRGLREVSRGVNTEGSRQTSALVRIPDPGRTLPEVRKVPVDVWSGLVGVALGEGVMT